MMLNMAFLGTAKKKSDRPMVVAARRREAPRPRPSRPSSEVRTRWRGARLGMVEEFGIGQAGLGFSVPMVHITQLKTIFFVSNRFKIPQKGTWVGKLCPFSLWILDITETNIGDEIS